MAGMNFTELINKAGLTPEQKAEAEKIFGIPSLTTLIEETAMHTANEAFSARKSQLEASWNTANEEYKAMLTSTETTAAELTQAKADLAAATEKLKTANPGIDLDKLTADITKVVMEKAGVLELGRGATELDAVECVAQHRELFGQSLSARTLVQEALAAKKSPTAYWEEKYGVAQKRSDLAKAATEQHDREVEERGYKKRISEEAHPGARTLAPSKDPFWVPKPATTEGMQPWEATEVPADETALLNELQAARG